ncbi:MAG: flavodoxin domain-containing protein [Proteobacteria bacterium]|jgi:flavorubredoxin|nr:flavodoxin domain-containing protein [Pseudomonadota bacterium]
MPSGFRAVEITDRVFWVGAVDFGLRNFHGYLTSRGTTYNAFLVLADKPTLIDTVKAPFGEEMMARIASVIEPSKIEHIVSNHSEMDHSGFLPEAIARLKPSKLFASAQGCDALERHFHFGRPIEAVKTGDSLDIGGATLKFVESRMLHWPDSMLTYLAEGGVLFSNDAFGMHLASSERFADELPRDLLRAEAAKYYANILLPLSPILTAFLGKLPGFGLDIRTIAPDHGPIWREDAGWIVERYAEWAAQKPTRKAVVVYDTMWGSTAKMARAIGDGLAAGGATAILMPLDAAHRSDVATELLGAGALLVGSPTMNNQIFPTVADTMTYLEGLRPKNLVGASFGSFGWSGEATAHLDERLARMKIELVAEGLKVKYVPDGEQLEACRNLGLAVAEKLPHAE